MSVGSYIFISSGTWLSHRQSAHSFEVGLGTRDVTSFNNNFSIFEPVTVFGDYFLLLAAQCLPDLNITDTQTHTHRHTRTHTHTHTHTHTIFQTLSFQEVKQMWSHIDIYRVCIPTQACRVPIVPDGLRTISVKSFLMIFIVGWVWSQWLGFVLHCLCLLSEKTSSSHVRDGVTQTQSSFHLPMNACQIQVRPLA